MNELDITVFKTTENMVDYSASVAEIGADAATTTWLACIAYVVDNGGKPWPVDDQDIQEYIGSFGAWSDEEIDSFTSIELQAFLTQDIAGNIRNDGVESGVIFTGINGKSYYYLDVS